MIVNDKIGLMDTTHLQSIMIEVERGHNYGAYRVFKKN